MDLAGIEMLSRDRVFCAYGRTNAGRYLLVVLSESADGRWYVATARELTDTEMRMFRRKGLGKDIDTMSAKTNLEALAEHYDSTDTAAELKAATAVTGPDMPHGADRMVTFAVRLPLVALERVREIAEQRSVTTSALIRRWIDVGIAEDGRDASDRAVPVEALLELIGRAPREHIGR